MIPKIFAHQRKGLAVHALRQRLGILQSLGSTAREHAVNLFLPHSRSGVLQHFSSSAEALQTLTETVVLKGLYEVIADAAGQELLHNLHAVCRSHHDDLRAHTGLVELIQELISVHAGRVVVQHDEVNFLGLKEFQCFLSVFTYSDDRKVRGPLDITPVNGCYHRVIFYNQYSVHHSTPFRRSALCKAVRVIVKQLPSPGSVSTETSPPYLSATCLTK